MRGHLGASDRGGANVRPIQEREDGVLSHHRQPDQCESVGSSHPLLLLRGETVSPDRGPAHRIGAVLPVVPGRGYGETGGPLRVEIVVVASESDDRGAEGGRDGKVPGTVDVRLTLQVVDFAIARWENGSGVDVRGDLLVERGRTVRDDAHNLERVRGLGVDGGSVDALPAAVMPN